MACSTPLDLPGLLTERGQCGVGRAVALLEVLDFAAGLGTPITPLSPPAGTDGERDRLLLELAQEALMAGTGEVVFDDGYSLVTSLVLKRDDALPRSAEFAVQLLADSVDAFPEQEDRLAQLARSEGESSATPDVLQAQFAFGRRPRSPAFLRVRYPGRLLVVESACLPG
ncbi:lantibiotic dehydratase [Kitasatospora sp. NPDC058048]|uniref:lantibiotic dehydratase n=1 Tax=Kitasatospora sp. NPDC058048 TaxID=3346313 RepID=UPI0036DBC9DA